MQPRLKIASIFRTIDGEVTHHGPWHWTTFVRLGGCNLRCWKSSGFCDAPHTLDLKFPYPEMEVQEILGRVQELKTVRVTITGGEPMLQALVNDLGCELQKFHYIVTIETSGSILIDAITLDSFTSIIMDVKPPSTEMAKMNITQNMAKLRPRDFAKFVVDCEEDFLWSLKYLEKYPTAAQVAIGPRWGKLEPKTVLEWIERAERFDIMLNVQTHKYIWPECNPPGVASLKDVDHKKLIELER